MNIKEIIQKLRIVKDNIAENDGLSEDDKKLLESLTLEPLKIDEGRSRPIFPKNDNGQLAQKGSLTSEQHFRLRLIEKTGTGSHAIH